MPKYSIGIDFGTLSARALVVNTENGQETGTGESLYPHGVMTSFLPASAAALPTGFALQHPDDYRTALSECVAEAMMNAGVDPGDIIAIGIDFTSDTCLPVDEAGEPLCLKPEFEACPHAWVKLWKHHGALEETAFIRETVEKRGLDLLDQYGGQVSPEYMLPKLLETCRKAPQVVEAADRFLEAGDWITGQITGRSCKSLSYAGFKAFYQKSGWPDSDFFASLHPLLGKKGLSLLRGKLLAPGECAGRLNQEWARRLGLPEGIPVAVPGTDALTPMPALGLTRAGGMLMSLGTSSCHTLVSDENKPFQGVCGVIWNGILPNLYGYESGQSGTGDLLDWAAKTLASEEIEHEATNRAISVQQVLTEKAEQLLPGESGLLALDWWNGCRSVLMNGKLSGVLLGLTLATRPEEIYRALIEATAFGTRMIVESHINAGVAVDKVVACGGISRKNPMAMQIYTDVLGMELSVSSSKQAAALGSAIFGALAAGREAGGWDSVREAADHMGCKAWKVYRPDPHNHEIYEQLFREYKRLHDYFGRGENPVLENLRALSDAQKEKERQS